MAGYGGLMGIRRRDILIFPLAAIVATPAMGEGLARAARVGYVWIGVRGSDESSAGLRQGFADRGYLVGRNLVLEERYADGHPERLAALIAELIALPVDVLMTPGTPITRAAQRATSTVPIVSVSGDPIGTGLVASLSRPGGNITGLSLLSGEYSVKWLELLKEAAPRLHRIAVLWNPDNSGGARQLERLRQVAPGLDLELAAFSARPADIDASLVTIAAAGLDGLVVSDDPFLETIELRLIAFAAQRGLPALYSFSGSVRRGGLMSYSANFFDVWRRAAGYADRIIKGARPSELPIEQSTDFALRINLKTAKALGLVVPPSLLARADEVIE
jgi:putative ABC transport system substrate-binding protein